jgi:CTP:phosphocholine cytidylyltransferase-like protein
MFLDIPTCWNSTYMMLITTLEFRQVFPTYSNRDQNFIWAPTHEEWEKIENVCEVLEIFNDVTNIISGSDYLTVNLFLTEVWRVKDILAKKSWDENDYIKAMVVKMNIKFEKY